MKISKLRNKLKNKEWLHNRSLFFDIELQKFNFDSKHYELPTGTKKYIKKKTLFEKQYMKVRRQSKFIKRLYYENT